MIRLDLNSLSYTLFFMVWWCGPKRKIVLYACAEYRGGSVGRRRLGGERSVHGESIRNSSCQFWWARSKHSTLVSFWKFGKSWRGVFWPAGGPLKRHLSRRDSCKSMSSSVYVWPPRHSEVVRARPDLVSFRYSYFCSVTAWSGMRVRMTQRERERERERERGWVWVWVCVCVCVCVCVWERVRVCVWVWEREREREYVRVCTYRLLQPPIQYYYAYHKAVNYSFELVQNNFEKVFSPQLFSYCLYQLNIPK